MHSGSPGGAEGSAGGRCTQQLGVAALEARHTLHVVPELLALAPPSPRLPTVLFRGLNTLVPPGDTSIPSCLARPEAAVCSPWTFPDKLIREQPSPTQSLGWGPPTKMTFPKGSPTTTITW